MVDYFDILYTFDQLLCCDCLYPVVLEDEYLFPISLYKHAGSGLEFSHPSMPNIHLTIQRHATAQRYPNNQTVNHFCLCLRLQSLSKWHVECR